MENGWDFIVRMTGRNVLSWNGLHEIHWLAQQCTMRHSHHVEFDSHGRECSVQISFAKAQFCKVSPAVCEIEHSTTALVIETTLGVCRASAISFIFTISHR